MIRRQPATPDHGAATDLDAMGHKLTRTVESALAAQAKK